MIEDEFAKLSTLDPSSSEYNVSKNYLDWLTVMPWNKHSEDNFDVIEAMRILDEERYGIQPDPNPNPNPNWRTTTGSKTSRSASWSSSRLGSSVGTSKVKF